MFVFVSGYVMFDTLLSIFVYAAARLFFAWLVSVHVPYVYVIAGSTHVLYTCLFKCIPMLPFKMLQCLVNAVHPTMTVL